MSNNRMPSAVPRFGPTVRTAKSPCIAGRSKPGVLHRSGQYPDPVRQGPRHSGRGRIRANESRTWYNRPLPRVATMKRCRLMTVALLWLFAAQAIAAPHTAAVENRDFVAQLYRDLLGRTPDVDGLAF